jgi:hypothetical protein
MPYCVSIFVAIRNDTLRRPQARDKAISVMSYFVIINVNYFSSHEKKGCVYNVWVPQLISLSCSMCICIAVSSRGCRDA